MTMNATHSLAIDPAAEGLAEDHRTAWVPDVAGNLEVPALLGRPNLQPYGRPFQRLAVPKADGSEMRVPVLHPSWHVALHQATDPLRSDIDALLRPGVIGYRRGADPQSHYAKEWRRFSDSV